MDLVWFFENAISGPDPSQHSTRYIILSLHDICWCEIFLQKTSILQFPKQLNPGRVQEISRYFELKSGRSPIDQEISWFSNHLNILVPTLIFVHSFCFFFYSSGICPPFLANFHLSRKFLVVFLWETQHSWFWLLRHFLSLRTLATPPSPPEYFITITLHTLATTNKADKAKKSPKSSRARDPCLKQIISAQSEDKSSSNTKDDSNNNNDSDDDDSVELVGTKAAPSTKKSKSIINRYAL